MQDIRVKILFRELNVVSLSFYRLIKSFRTKVIVSEMIAFYQAWDCVAQRNAIKFFHQENKAIQVTFFLSFCKNYAMQFW